MKDTTITLTENESAFIDAQISTGKFENESAVLKEALRVLEERSQKDELLLNALQEGEASGYDENFDPQQFKELFTAKPNGAFNKLKNI